MAVLTPTSADFYNTRERRPILNDNVKLFCHKFALRVDRQLNIGQIRYTNRDTYRHRYTDKHTHRHILDFLWYKLDMLCILCHCRNWYITVKCFFQELCSPYVKTFLASMFPNAQELTNKIQNTSIILITHKKDFIGISPEPNFLWGFLQWYSWFYKITCLYIFTAKIWARCRFL